MAFLSAELATEANRHGLVHVELEFIVKTVSVTVMEAFQSVSMMCYPFSSHRVIEH